MKLSSIMLAIGATALAAAAVACGSSTSNSDKTSTAEAKAPANATAAATTGTNLATSSAPQKQVTITAVDFSFSASAVSVSKGDTVAVTFKNNGTATHTLTFYLDDAYTTAIPGADTSSVNGGGTASLTVTAGPGLYYRCNIHPTQMMGEIEIQ